MAHLFHTFVEIDQTGDKAAFPRVRQHLLGEIGGAFGRGLDLGNMLSNRRQRTQRVESKVSVAQNPDEQVIEIVGDATCQNAQTLEFLGLLNLGLSIVSVLLLC